MQLSAGRSCRGPPWQEGGRKMGKMMVCRIVLTRGGVSRARMGRRMGTVTRRRTRATPD